MIKVIKSTLLAMDIEMFFELGILLRGKIIFLRIDFELMKSFSYILVLNDVIISK